MVDRSQGAWLRAMKGRVLKYFRERMASDESHKSRPLGSEIKVMSHWPPRGGDQR